MPDQQKRIRSRAAHQSRCLRVEKKPLLGVDNFFRSIWREQLQCRSIWLARGMFTMPAVQRQMFAVAVPLYRGAQNQRKPLRSNGSHRRAPEKLLFDPVLPGLDLIS